MLHLFAATAYLADGLALPPSSRRAPPTVMMAAGRRGRPVRRGRSNNKPAALEWRVYDVRLPVEPEAAEQDYEVTPQLNDAVAERLGMASATLPAQQVSIVRRSLDARPDRHDHAHRALFWSYVVDVKLDSADAARLK